jgi:hypothetical protein
MAPTKQHNLGINRERLAALEALAHENRSDMTKELVAALEARIAAWRAGCPQPRPAKTYRGFGIGEKTYRSYRIGDELTEELAAALEAQISDWRAGKPPATPHRQPKTKRSFRISDDLWADVTALAYENRTTVIAEAIAAIDAHVASRQRNGAPEAKPSLRDRPFDERLLDAQRQRAGRDMPAGQCPPHPKARVHKGFCGACGRPV